MARQQISLKQLAINKDNTTIMVAVGLATFLVVFCLISSNALVKQLSYQSKVIGLKKNALKQLKSNVSEVEKLKSSYQVFADTNQNVLGGSKTGQGELDGENPRLVLDALPSKYDFPALATSLEKVFKEYRIENIEGVDDEVAQSALPASASPQPIEMPFSITVVSTADSGKKLLEKFEKSIRPIQIVKLEIEGSATDLKFTVDAKTYFQPQKIFDVKSEKVK